MVIVRTNVLECFREEFWNERNAMEKDSKEVIGFGVGYLVICFAVGYLAIGFGVGYF